MNLIDQHVTRAFVALAALMAVFGLLYWYQQHGRAKNTSSEAEQNEQDLRRALEILIFGVAISDFPWGERKQAERETLKIMAHSMGFEGEEQERFSERTDVHLSTKGLRDVVDHLEKCDACNESVDAFTLLAFL